VNVLQINQREVAVDVLVEVTMGGAYNSITLRNALARNNALSRQDKAFVTELVNGTLRNMIFADYVINKFSKTPTSKMKPFVLNVLRAAVYQILFMDKTPDFAVCDESVKLVKKRGLQGLAPFVNGVLRNIARNKAEISVPESDICTKYSYPRWMVDYWLTRYDAETVEKICKGLNQTPKVSVAVNTLRVNKNELAKMLRAEGVNVADGAYLDNMLLLSETADISALKAFKDGLFFVMDESSMLAAKILASKAGAKVLDICSAPGGKACALACLSDDKAQIRAFDIYEHKIWLIEDTLKRLGMKSVTPELLDATKFEPALENSADYVLLDAPCSGLGLLRKKPEIKYRKTMADIEELAKLQKEMLANVSRYVAPGGCLVYSVCTISPLEAEDMVDWFTANYPFELEAIEGDFIGKPGITIPKEGCIQVLPVSPEVTADAFFIAKLRRSKA